MLSAFLAEGFKTLTNWRIGAELNFSSTVLTYLAISMIDLPRYHWIVEMNGYGYAYRKWLNIPKWAPLPFYGDHGVLTAGYLVDHELEQESKLFFTFGKPRYDSIKDAYQHLHIVRCPSPWVMYRRLEGIKLSPNAEGTLIFVPKSLPEYKREFSLSDYVERVVTSKKYEAPYTFVLHHHDHNSEIAEQIKKYKFKIISFGSDSFYSNIINNFYAAAKNHSYAVSAFPGSELYYAHELGMSFSKIMVDIKGMPLSKKLDSVFKRQLLDKCSQQAASCVNELFADDISHNRKEQDSWISNMLSLDLATLKNTQYFRSLVLKQFLPQSPYYLKNISKRALQRL
jgi:hypothetical protein